MSSILDALNKLEAEKEGGKGDQEHISQELAEKELTGGGPFSDRLTIRIKPITFIFLAVASAATLAGASIGIYVIFTGSSPETPPSSNQGAVAPTAPVTRLEATTPEPEAPPVTEPTTNKPSTLAFSETPGVPDRSQEPDGEDMKMAAAIVAPPLPETASNVLEETAPATPREAPLTQEQTPPPPPINPADYVNLPRLTERQLESYGLGSLKLNMVLPAGSDRPRAVAIINMKKVYQGQYIGDSEIKLIHVDKDKRGVAIEIASTGERFFADF